MGDELRKTGISILGDVPWATHFCQFYQTKEDLLDILVPYFKAGLENNEAAMWVTSSPLTVTDAKQALARAVPDLAERLTRGQIEIVPHTKWYLKNGYFDLQRVLNGWVDKLNQALERGYSGLRVTGNTAWLEKKDWQGFTDYEAAINGVIGRYKLLALCTYSLDKCSANEIMDVVSNHEFALIKREGSWTLIEGVATKQSKEALQLQALLLDNVGEAIFSTDKDLRILTWNKTAETMYGWRADEVIGRDWHDTLHLEYPENNREEALRQLLERGSWRGEVVHRRKDGTPIYVLASRSLLKDERGNVLGIVAIAQDITERKRAEERISHLASFPEMNPNPIIEMDSSGHITYANPGAEKTFPDLLGAAGQHRYLAGWQSIVTTMESGKGHSLNREVKIGDRYYVQTIQYLKERGLLRFYGWDITERKRMEEELARVRDELEIKVKERTAELVQAEHELRALSNRVIAIQEEERRAIARELHDQIGQSMTMAKLLLERARKSPPDKAASFLSEASQQLSEVIGQVRNLSLALRPSMLDDLGLVPTLVWLCERVNTQSGLRVKFEHDQLDSLPPPVNTTAYRIVQEALTNVLRHARATEAKVQLRAESETLCLSVGDNGCGFDIRVLPIGASSGLSGMRERAKLLGGSFTVESAPGSGTRITVVLPILSQANTPPAN